MSAKINKVIVIGGSGNTGPYIIDALQDAGFKVAVLSRKSSRTQFRETITVHRTDYEETSLTEIFRDFDAIVSVVATFSTDQQKTIVDAAIKAGVKRFLPSEYGIDTSSSQLAEVVSMARGKQETVAYLKTKETTQLSWTALCVGAFFDWVLKVGGGLMGWDVPAGRATVYDSGDQPYEATTMRQIGRAVAGVLKHPDETKNKYIYVNSFTLTQNQVVGALEKASGVKFQVTKSTTKEIGDEGYRNAENGNPGLGFPQIVTSAIYGYGGMNNFSANRELANEMFGLPKESLEETIKEVLNDVNFPNKI